MRYFVGVQNDTSVRDRLVVDLAAGEAALRGVFQASPVALGIVRRGITGRATQVRINPAAAELFGTAPDAAEGRTFPELGGPAGLGRRLEAAFDEIDAGGGPVRFRLDEPGGPRPRSFTVAVTAVEGVETIEGAPPRHDRRDERRYCYSVEDLTEFDRSERDRALMRAAVERADRATVVISPDLDPPGPKFVYVNPAAAGLLGRDADDLTGSLLTDLDGPATDPHFPTRFRGTLRETGAFRGDAVAYRPDGTPVEVEWSVSAVRDDGGQTTQFVATLADVADRRETERRVLEAQTREQARIAQDLHDGVAQQLAGLSMLCGMLARQVEAGEDAAESVAQIREIVGDAARDLRGVSHGLMPLDAGPGGLTAGLRRLARRTTQTGAAECDFRAPAEDVPVHDPQAAHHLYRIAQEAVGNAVQHGGAGRVTLGLARTGPHRAALTVTDDGAGLPAELLPDGYDPAAGPVRADDLTPDPGGGLGLTGMRFRARSVGGTLVFERPEGGGARVVCEFPHHAPG